MKKFYYLIILTVILGLVLTGCFLSNVGQVPTNEQSGITYLTKATEGAPLVTTLFADQDIDVGTVSVWNGINEVLGVECLYVKYDITVAGWCLIKTHLAVANSLDGIPQTRKDNPIPGQFPYKHEDLGFATDDVYIIPLSEIGDEEVECEDIFYIAAQASLQNLNNPDELVGTVTVNADNPSAICSLFDLESGKMYQLEANGTAFASANIEFDAKYSSKNGGTWSDTVTGYIQYGPELLELKVDGEFVDWGAVYNPAHVYYWDMTGKGSCVALLIYDLPGSYGNNSRSLTVDIYLYQEESAWAGIADEEEGTQIPFDGKNWATYFTYKIENLLPTISSEDLAGPFTADEFGYFTVTTVNPLCGFAYEHVLFNYTIFGIAPSNIVSFKYYDEGTATWYDAPVIQDGSNVIGFFGPPTGFPMGVPYNESTTFEIKIDTMGTYPVTIILNDLDDGNAVLAILNQDVVVSPETLLEIGDSYGGGKVAYILQSGDPGYVAGEQHGLIAAIADQSTGIQWYNGSYVTTDATGIAIGTGQANTTAIVTIQGVGNYAAQLCDDLTEGGYDDWFLPSKDELNKLYLNKVAIGGWAGYEHWSSSEYNAIIAWNQNFYYGYQANYSKNNTFRVRPVRAF